MPVGEDEKVNLRIAPVHGSGDLDAARFAARFGARASALRALSGAGFSVPEGIALSAEFVAAFDPASPDPELLRALAPLLDGGAAAVRPSPAMRRSGEGASILDLTTPEAVCAAIVEAREAYGSISGRTLRIAMGAGAESELPVVVQKMAAAPDRIWFRRASDGRPEVSFQHGRLQARDLPDDLGPRLEALFGDAVELHAAPGGADGLVMLDVYPAVLSPRAGLKVAVDLAERGAITIRDALLRADPAALTDELHPRLAPGSDARPLSRGLAASPGAASGALVFSATAAERAAAAGEAAILARIETGPEDIRGMHAAAGVLTIKGGLSSHAAVVARGLGRPCVVGPQGLSIDREAKALILPDGRRLAEGAALTIDGSVGDVFEGRAKLEPPEPSTAFATLMRWADEVRGLRVRANADTAEEARIARHLGAEGIGLVRTEHMLFAPGREVVMRSLILSETPEDREAALSELLAWQRADFIDLFEIMSGLPVTIRLLDPPLHEFLPRHPHSIRALARQLGRSEEAVAHRVEELREFNPMLGMRGCRVGVTQPDIYAMQARAVFEAAADAAERTGEPVIPEIMIPLVSAKREMELLKSVVDGAAAAVRRERGEVVAYRFGAMVETPRAALRAGYIAETAEFLSFGTNDLTQMAYGLSRDDAGRFMRDYVRQGVFPEDPFQTLDTDGVGELLRLGAERGRAARPGVTLGICGEHGGDGDSIRFFDGVDFDYISCSPYRVPVARLAAAQAKLSTSDSAR